MGINEAILEDIFRKSEGKFGGIWRNFALLVSWRNPWIEYQKFILNNFMEDFAKKNLSFLISGRIFRPISTEIPVKLPEILLRKISGQIH